MGHRERCIGQQELGYDYLAEFFSSEKTVKTRYLYQKYLEMDRNFDSCRDEERFKAIIQ